jgi:hypothetical protein
MGYVSRSNSSRAESGVPSLCWECLGRAVQSRTLEAVALHFFEVGLAELCLVALAESKNMQGINNE